MPFGRRRFEKLVLHSDGEMCAYFLPLDLNLPAEFVTEEQLQAEIAAQTTVMDDAEERLAFNAFSAYHRGKSTTRARVEAAQRKAFPPTKP